MKDTVKVKTTEIVKFCLFNLILQKRPIFKREWPKKPVLKSLRTFLRDFKMLMARGTRRKYEALPLAESEFIKDRFKFVDPI